MRWRVESAPEVERDVTEAVQWYELQQPGLGKRFSEEIIQIWDELAVAFLPSSSRKEHPLALPGTFSLPDHL